MPKLGRNDPCHCGSGRKYKRCCLGLNLPAAAGGGRYDDPGPRTQHPFLKDLYRAYLKRKTRERRVVLQRRVGTDRYGSRSVDTVEVANGDAWLADVRRGVLSDVKTHPVARLTDSGVEFGVAPGPGDQLAYGMDPYRTDDCFQAAIATCTQIPIEQVPDLQLDRRRARGEDCDEIGRTSWERVDKWATKRGLAMLFHERVPVASERWIGVIGGGDTGEGHFDELDYFQDHSLVMSHDRLIFDPSCSVKPVPGSRLMRYDPADIGYGITFDAKGS